VQGIDPGGLIVDCLRSCYSTKVRFFPNDPTQTDVIWYFVPEDRPFLPFASAFASRNYDDERTDWPDGKQQPPAGDGTEVGEVLGAPRPWRDGSDPIHYPGTHVLGTAQQFAKGIDPPLVYANVCDTISALVPGDTRLRWVFFNDFFVDPGGDMFGFSPCEGLEAMVRSIFQGRIIKDSFKLRLIDASTTTGPITSDTVYADINQPTDPSYAPIALPAAGFGIQENIVPLECFWFADHDVRYFVFTNEAFIRGAFITLELDPGVERIGWIADVNPPLHVPDTGGHLGIGVRGLSYLSGGPI
jgi:hypothetical protein